jgi:hypothetical protein
MRSPIERARVGGEREERRLELERGPQVADAVQIGAVAQRRRHAVGTASRAQLAELLGVERQLGRGHGSGGLGVVVVVGPVSGIGRVLALAVVLGILGPVFPGHADATARTASAVRPGVTPQRAGQGHEPDAHSSVDNWPTGRIRPHPSPRAFCRTAPACAGRPPATVA